MVESLKHQIEERFFDGAAPAAQRRHELAHPDERASKFPVNRLKNRGPAEACIASQHNDAASRRTLYQAVRGLLLRR